MNLNSKQIAALQEAQASGQLFQLPENPRHSPATLAALVKAGLLVKAPVGVVWTLAPQCAVALDAHGQTSKGA